MLSVGSRDTTMPWSWAFAPLTGSALVRAVRAGVTAGHGAGNVRDATSRIFTAFTRLLHSCKTAAVKFDMSADEAGGGGVETVPTLQTLINQSATNLDVVTPIKARACDALNLVRRNKSREQDDDSRVMRKGAERC